MKKASDIHEYIAQAPREAQEPLRLLRAAIRKAAPKAVESISYGMPFYEYGGTGYKGRLIYFAVFKNHIGIFIPPSLGTIPKELLIYKTAKSSFRFPLDKPIPLALIGKTVRELIRQKDLANKKKG